jgi:CDP-paratose synthetase
MPKNILITGITGFLGSHLAKRFLNEGHNIIGLKRSTSSLARINSIENQITLYDSDTVEFASIFQNHSKIDALIHTATCYGRSGETTNQIFDANTVYPLHLLEAASQAGIKIFINTDTTLDKYLNLYSLSKNQFLDWGRFFSLNKKIHFCNLRLEHFYGPNDDDSKFTTFILKSCIENHPTIKLTHGEQKRDFIYVDDVVDAYLLVIESFELIKNNYIEMDVGSGNAVSIRHFVETVHRITHSKTQLIFGALPYRRGEVMLSQANTEPLNKLGWSCKTELESGLIKMMEGHKQ